MEDFLVPLGFFALVAYISKLISDTRIRRKAIDSGLSEEKAKAFYHGSWAEPSTRGALKWGLVVMALGLGLLLVEIFTISFESPFAYAVLLVATGIALLGYYLIERDNEDRYTPGPFSSSERSSSESVDEPDF